MQGKCSFDGSRRILPGQRLRALLRHRASLVRLGTQLRNRIHAVAADFGYDRAGSYWTGPGRGWLAELDLPGRRRVHRAGHAGRDRRHHPVRQRPQAGELGRADPTVRGSDLTVRHGHISKQGSAWLRWVLNQAAQTAKRSPEFAASYQAIARRRGKKIATIAISRKLLTRAYHLLAGQAAGTPATTPHTSAAT